MPERAHADHVEALDDRIEAELLGPADDVGEGDQDRAEEAEQADQGAADLDDPFAKLGQDPRRSPACSSGRTCAGASNSADLLEQAGLVAAGADDLGLAVADGAIDEPGADRVHALDLRRGRWSADRASASISRWVVAARVIVSAPATR